MFSGQRIDQLSLNDLVNDFNEQYDTSLTKQGLQERFNDRAVCFMTSLLEENMTHQLQGISTDQKSVYENKFRRIRVKDSTRFSLPEAFASVYKGHGGATSSAQISIQYEYDLLSRKAIELKLTGACRNDQQDSKETLDSIQEGDLLIRDLAYTGKAYLKHITKTGAYYLNRLNPTWKIYTYDDNQIDFANLLKKIDRYELPYMEIEAFIKIDAQKIDTRLIVSKVNQEVYEKRIRKAEKAAKSKGYQVSEEYKVKAWLNLFMTNIPKEWLTTDQIRKTYSLRWQIELVFKTWKSQAQINKIKHVRVERFQCQLIARLIWVLIHWQTLRITQEWIILQGCKFQCSQWKFYKTAFRLSPLLRKTLFGISPIGSWLEKILINAEKKYNTETKKGKSCTFTTINNLLA